MPATQPTQPTLALPPDFGEQPQRIKFLRHLRDDQRFTQQDLAAMSTYGLESVKAWFSDNPKRKRNVPDRALILLLHASNISMAQYRVIVR